MKRLVLLIAGLILPGYAANAQPPPKFVRVFPRRASDWVCSDYVIDRRDGRNITLVVYAPKSPGTYPAILEIHGGGWREQQVDNDRPLAERLAERGFVVAIVDYRLSIEARYPAALWDCKTAVRYLRAHATELHLDPRRIGAMGGSAGGHLSGLLATTNGLTSFEGDGPNQEQSSSVKAAIVMAGSMDLVPSEIPHASSYALDFFGVACADNPALYREASPLNHIGRDTPPIIFIEGEKDSAKPGRPEMQAKLRQLGIPTEVYTLKYAPHPFWMSQPWLDQTVNIAADFFHRYL